MESCRVSGGLERIDAYFRQHAAPRNRAVFLSETFGIGGRSHALSGAAHSAESHDRSGIRLQKGNCPEVRLTWHQAAVRLDDLMRNGRHREGQEQDSFPEAPEMAPTAEAPVQRSVQELLDQYKPAVSAALMEDAAYRNACAHSDQENAEIEGGAAIRRAVLASGDLELVRCYADTEEFRRRLHQELFQETYPILHAQLRPLTQEDIDDALREWNGDADSKRAVFAYMQSHGQEAGAAGWLRSAYGDDLPAFPVTIRGSAADLPWEDVRRFLAALIAEERFFTPEEQDEEIHPAAIRQALEARGIVDGQVVDQEKLDSDPFLRQVMADAARAEAVREIAEPVGEKPETAAMEKVSPGAAGTVYPAAQNQLPFDVVVEPLALEQSPPETPSLPARNFRITDSQLGVGGAKTRYGWNIAAIRILQTLEAEGRPATPQEQEVLSLYAGPAVFPGF